VRREDKENAPGPTAIHARAGLLLATVGTGHPGEHHPWFGQPVRCDGMETVAGHEDDVAGFAGQFDDAERYLMTPKTTRFA
jgi:hypothetical protein